MVADPAQISDVSCMTALIFDGAIVMARFALKVLLLGLIIRVISKHESETHLKPLVLTTLAVVAGTFLLNTSPDGVIGVYQFFVVAFIATMVLKKVFWLDIDKALVAAFLFVFLSISLTDYSGRGLDLAIPGRVTIERALAEAMDRCTRASPGDPAAEFPPHRRIMPALVQMMMDPKVEERSPRSGGTFAESIARALYNVPGLFSKSGHPPPSPERAGAPRENASTPRDHPPGAVAPQAPSPEAAAAVPPGTPPATMAAEDSPAPPGEAPEKLPKLRDIRPIPTWTDQPSDTGVEDKSTGPVAVAESETTPSAGTFDALSPAEQELWKRARSSINVSGVGTSMDGGYALVGGTFVPVGSLWTVDFQNRRFTYRLDGINESSVCQWKPILSTNELPQTAGMITF